jgi:hypothetical protein
VIAAAAKLGMVQGGTVVSLSLPSARPAALPPGKSPVDSPGSSYGKAKSALDAAP